MTRSSMFNIFCALTLLLFASSSILLAASEPDSESPPEKGRWERINAQTGDSDPPLSSEQQNALQHLQSIGYLTGSQRPTDQTGVIVYQPDKALNGLNFYVSGHDQEAILMDMEGPPLHSWSSDIHTIFPDRVFPNDTTGTDYWRRAWLQENGDILVIYEGLGLARLDKNSDVVWKFDGLAHHDLDFDEDGNTHVLTRRAQMNDEVSAKWPILEDYVVTLDASGVQTDEMSVLQCLLNSRESNLPDIRLADMGGDVLHTNSIDVLDGRFENLGPAFRKGNLLLSIRYLDLLVIVDPRIKEVVWSMAGKFRLQHHAKVLETGNLLLFDNEGLPGRSRIFEIDMLTGHQIWKYAGTPEAPFYSNTCGTCYRLSNGNTLIVESDPGRAFEVTPAGEIVWEFMNPHRAGNEDQFIATLFDLQRIPREFTSDWFSQ